MFPYLPWYLGGTAMLVATNWLSVTIPLYVADGVDALALGAEGHPAIRSAALAVLLMGGAVIVVRTTSRVLFFTPGRLVEARVKEDLFRAVLRQQPAFLDRWPAGDLVSRASSDVTMLRLLSGFTALGIVNTVLAVALTATQMLRMSAELTAWVVLPLAVGFAISLAFVQRMFPVMKRIQESAADVSEHALMSYQSVATVRAFRAERTFSDQFAQRADAWLEAILARTRLSVGIGPVLGMAAGFNVFLLLFIGGPMTIEGQLTVGELVAFTTLVAYLTGPLRGMSFILSLFRQAQSSLERLEEITVPEPERPDLPDPAPVPTAPPALTIRDLRFAYPDEPDTEVLHGVSVTVPAGGTLGIFGPTGSGKTTLLRCLARLYNPPPGAVLVDGVDVRELDLDAWRQAVAYVPQRAFLFSESLKDNVLLGQGDAGRFWEVARLAALEPDIVALPDKEQSQVGEAGLMLSGGQRQRTALARGLARPHHVLVLDDVLSAVDHATEQQLIQSLRQHGSPTTLLVSNRLSALRHADVIAILDNGELVETGTHDELVARPGPYRDTWERQREGDEEGAA